MAKSKKETKKNDSKASTTKKEDVKSEAQKKAQEFTPKEPSENNEKQPKSKLPKKVEEYLASEKQPERIIQEIRGGNFVSASTREIYIPLSLLK